MGADRRTGGDTARHAVRSFRWWKVEDLKRISRRPRATSRADDRHAILRAGIPVPLQTMEEATTKKAAKVEQRFMLEVTAPVEVNGDVIMPAGTPVRSFSRASPSAVSSTKTCPWQWPICDRPHAGRRPSDRGLNCCRSRTGPVNACRAR